MCVYMFLCVYVERVSVFLSLSFCACLSECICPSVSVRLSVQNDWCLAWWTDADEAVDVVDTGGVVSTGIRRTFVNIRLTMKTSVT